jgi:HAD superfamily hydrolase (TIGR01509 family)
MLVVPATSISKLCAAHGISVAEWAETPGALMASTLPFSTVLFDVDGTLIDSNGAHAETWAQACREHDIDVAVSRVRALVGMGSDNLLPALAHVSEDSDLGRAIARRKQALFQAFIPGLQPTRGARALVEYLREQQIDIVIATSADEHELTVLLHQAHVDDLIPTRASKDDAAASKPDPDIVRAALQRAGANPEASVLIGDTPYDIEAATRAEVAAIALRCGGYWSDQDLRGAAVVLDDPAALLDRLRASRIV